MSTQFLTVRQTAEALNVSYMMAFRKISDKEIPSTRLGRKILVPAKFIEDLVTQTIECVRDRETDTVLNDAR